MRTRNSVSIPRRALSLPALLPLLFASCSVLFASPDQLEGTRRTLRIVGHLLYLRARVPSIFNISNHKTKWHMKIVDYPLISGRWYARRSS